MSRLERTLPALKARLAELTQGPVTLAPDPKRAPAGWTARTKVGCYACALLESARVGVLSRTLQDWPRSRRAGKPLIVVPYMGPAGRALCAASGTCWLDLSGNAEITAPGLLIHVEGRPNRFKARGRPWSAFAAKSSRVARFLLQDPRVYHAQREIAAATGLSESFVSKIVGRLEADALVERASDARVVRPRDPSLLLQAWEEDYDFFRHQVIRGHVPATVGEDLLRGLSSTLGDCNVRHAATGLSAAWLLAPHAIFRLVTVYVETMPEEEVLETLGFRETERGPNTWLVLPNDEGVFQGSTLRVEIPCVHPVQAVLDLSFHPERSQEAAQRVRESCLRWHEDETA